MHLLLLFCMVSVAFSIRPNLVFLLMDDMDSKLDALDVMPTFRQRFVSEGMTFRNAYVSSPKCCPSRNSLLTGAFAHRMNDTQQGWCGDFASAQRYDETFIAGIKKEGYTTGLFGKMSNQLGALCNWNGDGSSVPVPAGFNLSEGDAFVSMCNETEYYQIAFNRNGVMYTTPASGDAAYLQAFIGNETVPWLTRVATAAGLGEGPPFLAYLAPHAPHFSAEPAPWYAGAPLPSETAPRLPTFNASGEGKIWSMQVNAPLNDFTTSAIDLHFRNRQRSLMSVDDYVQAIFSILEATGVLNNTIVIASSDHGYHAGEFRMPWEKSLMYETDVNIPFYARGPGIVQNSTSEGLISLIDVGATFLELAGATQPGARTTDGRSITPLFRGAPPPPDWRTATLIEFMGVSPQWMTACANIFNMTPCPEEPVTQNYLIDGPQNTYAMLRIVNATMNVAYAEFRPMTEPPIPSATNWTEMYDMNADKWQFTNLAHTAPPAELKRLRDQLWSVATCALSECP